MKIFKNRIFVATFIMVLAAVTTFVGIPVYNNMSLARTTVVRAAKDIKVGTKIKGDMLESVSMGKLNLPADYISDSKLAIGKYATNDMQPHDMVTKRKISATDTQPNVKIRSLKPDEHALTIAPHSEASTFAYHLLPDDIVTVYEITKGTAKVVPELTYVSVLVETTSSGVQILKENQTDKDGNVLKPSTITFVVNPVQAKRLIELNNKGNFYFTLKYRGDDQNIKKKYLDAQAAYFNGSATVDAVESNNNPSSAASSPASSAADSAKASG